MLFTLVFTVSNGLVNCKRMCLARQIKLKKLFSIHHITLVKCIKSVVLCCGGQQ